MAADSKLPTPATAQDMYAHATVVELRALNRSITRLVNILNSVAEIQDVAAQGDEVDLKEPVEDKKPAHRDAKKKAG